MKIMKIAFKTHEIAQFKKNFLGGMPPNPPSNSSQLRCSRHAALQHVYPKSQKFESWALPLRNPAYASI